MFVVRLVLLASLLAVAACSSDIGAYSTSADDIMLARDLAAKNPGRIGAVQSSSAKPQSWISCRDISVGLPDDRTFHAYIAKALEDELKLGDLMTPNGAIQLGIHLVDLNFSSWEGTWEIVTDVSANGQELFQARGYHDHDAAWAAAQECENAADNFEYAVQDLVKNIISHPKFQALLAA
jgi:hypothetical protein